MTYNVQIGDSEAFNIFAGNIREARDEVADYIAEVDGEVLKWSDGGYWFKSGHDIIPVFIEEVRND